MAEVFGPPSPPPGPSVPHAAESFSSLHRPPISTLPSLVDTALREVRLHMYGIPAALAEVLDLQHKQGQCTAQRIKHPWINLEDRIWPLVPNTVWTDDPEQATIHVVPNAYIGHQCASREKETIRYIREGMARLLEYIVYAQPYYNRSGGRDHVVTSIFENGPLCDCVMREAFAGNDTFAFNTMMSMIKIGHWAHHDEAMFGWKAGYDIAMPQFGAVHDSFGPMRASAQRPSWQEIVSDASRFSFGFSGSYWGSRVTCPASIKGAAPDTLGGSHGCECSPGVRTWLKGYMSKHCNTSSAPTTRCSGMSGRMGTFWYALCPAAWACWSSRMYHAIDSLVVPVIMANGAIQPFEDVLDWRSFAIKLDTSMLIANNVSQLDWLHNDALDAQRFCSTCPTCRNCTRLPLVKRVRQLEQVRSWFLYNGTAPYNAIGLLLLELHCRQVHLKADGDAVCKRYHKQQALLPHAHSGNRHVSALRTPMRS